MSAVFSGGVDSDFDFSSTILLFFSDSFPPLIGEVETVSSFVSASSPFGFKLDDFTFGEGRGGGARGGRVEGGGACGEEHVDTFAGVAFAVAERARPRTKGSS